jgi:hypothetical protein
MQRGGQRHGAGRPKGSKQVRSSAHVIRAAKASGKLMPLDYLLNVMNDTQQGLKERLSAAIAAAPYFHPRLQSVAIQNNSKEPFQIKSELGEALKDLAETARQRMT